MLALPVELLAGFPPAGGDEAGALVLLVVVKGLRNLSGLKSPLEVPEKSEAKLTGVVTDAGEYLVTLRRISKVAVVVVGVEMVLETFGLAALVVVSAGFLFLMGKGVVLLGTDVGFPVVAVGGSCDGLASALRLRSPNCGESMICIFSPAADEGLAVDVVERTEGDTTS